MLGYLMQLVNCGYNFADIYSNKNEEPRRLSFFSVLQSKREFKALNSHQ
jgi:C4-type Zn-finger protein